MNRHFSHVIPSQMLFSINVASTFLSIQYRSNSREVEIFIANVTLGAQLSVPVHTYFIGRYIIRMRRACEHSRAYLIWRSIFGAWVFNCLSTDKKNERCAVRNQMLSLNAWWRNSFHQLIVFLIVILDD